MRRSHRIIVLVLAAAALSALPGHGASLPNPHTRTDPGNIGRPSLRIFNDEDGLPQNAVTTMAFNALGYLWAGTKDGIGVYNGREWLTLDLPQELGSSWILKVFPSSDGCMWVGTLGGGAARYDGKSWAIFNKSTGFGFSDVNDIIETTGDGGSRVLLLATDAGVSRFEHNQWSMMPPLAEARPNIEARCLFEQKRPDGSKVLWVGRGYSGLARFDNGSWTIFTHENSGLPSTRVMAMLETTAIDGRPVLLIGMYGDGLSKYDNGVFTRYEGAQQLPQLNTNCLVETVGADGVATLWAGTYSGLAKYDRDHWDYFSEDLGLPAKGVWSLLISTTKEGAQTIWLGTSGGGIARWQLGQWLTIDMRAGLPDDSVYGLLETTDGRGEGVLWVGTNSGGLARLGNGKWDVVNRSSSFNTDTVMCLAETKTAAGRSVVWVGTNSYGLARYENGSARMFGIKEGLPNWRINTLLAVDGPDGDQDLLVGTSAGLVRISRDRVIPADPAIQLPDQNIRALARAKAADGSDVLWIGTNAGLVRFEHGTSTVYDSGNGLPNNVILSALETGSEGGARTIWVGTRGGGAAYARLDGESVQWRTLSTATPTALPNNTIYRIEKDAAERLYLSTNKGIARLTPIRNTADEYSVYVYRTEDGLPSNECNTGSSMVDGRGRIWFGTIGGIAILDPSTEIADTSPKPLVLETAYLPDTGRVISPNEAIAYDQNHIVFQYALLNYYREADSRYRTQLVGFDREPSAWTTDYKKEYTSIPEGEYLFKVWGMDATGNVSGPVVIPFQVRPAPWLTWWAFMLYTLLLCAIVYLAIRLRMDSLRRRNVQLEARIDERTAQLGSKVEALRSSEQLALTAKNAALESERRALESERRALEANQAKSAFLANVSHELRTPLNAIIGFVQLMERDATLNTSQREHLDVIMRSGEHLLALINDVLSLSKIEAGRVSLEPTPFDLRWFLQGLEEMFRLRAVVKGLQVDFVLSDDLPRRVLGDEGKLRQVLINLLGNAVKFTEEGSVSVTVNWREGRARFDVRDSGPGMTRDDMSKLFEAFVQTRSGVASQEGTGLGLAISRDYALLMDGDITVGSELGVGSTFTLDISLPETAVREARADGQRVRGLAPDQAALKILVVDDVNENRRLLSKVLTTVGFDVEEVSDGREAVEAWSARNHDVVMMDVRMPVMDGVAATREIRRIERERGDAGRVHVIALTASAFDHDRERIFDAGCDDYIPKPFRQADIFQKLVERTGVRFVYERRRRSDELPAGESALTPERLGELPDDLIAALAGSVAIGDVASAMETVARIRSIDEPLARELRNLVRTYRFDELTDVLSASKQ